MSPQSQDKKSGGWRPADHSAELAALERQADQGAFAVRYARERLAIVDRDPDRVVDLLGGDLSSARQFVAVTDAMLELERPDDALAWAIRGIRETSGWQTDRRYDLACGIYEREGRPVEAIALRRAEHELAPTASTYGQLGYERPDISGRSHGSRLAVCGCNPRPRVLVIRPKP